MALTVVIALLAVALFQLIYEYRRDRSLPPGPRRLPLLGNIHQAPQILPWRTFDEWTRRYGPIMSAQFGLQTIIFIADPRIARELLDRRGSNYSDRPRMVMAAENVTKGLHLLMRPYNNRYKLHQRMEAPVLAPRASSTYFPVQDLESKQLLYDLLGSNDFPHHLERYSISLLFCLTYGYRFQTGHEPEMDTVRSVMRNFGYAGRVGTWLVDAIPALNRLPMCLAPWKRTAEEFYQLEADAHMTNLDRGLSNPGWNWTKEFSLSKQAHGMPKLELAYGLGILANAGFETTSAVMQIFILATRSYPNFIGVAQEELDRVVGPDRLPTIDDKEDLPYIRAVVEETLRWRSMAPSGVPHATSKGDIYMGYRIPKGATIVPLHWSMSLDENNFEKPLEFRPERWLRGTNEEKFSNFFGYGRRICTGRHIARNSLFTLISRILWAYNIQAPKDLDGKPIPVDDMAFGSGFVSIPTPFDAVFEPRSAHARSIIEREWISAQKDVGVLMDSVKDSQKLLGLDLRA